MIDCDRFNPQSNPKAKVVPKIEYAGSNTQSRIPQIEYEREHSTEMAVQRALSPESRDELNVPQICCNTGKKRGLELLHMRAVQQYQRRGRDQIWKSSAETGPYLLISTP